MFIASQKRKTNIAEYLLYMWQVEDIIRANDLDIAKIRGTIIDPYPGLDAPQRKQLEEWYESFIDMMRREEVVSCGHLQINNNTLEMLRELHTALLGDDRFTDYSRAYYEALPIIVELRARQGDTKHDEIETCFDALYGILLMRLQHKTISAATSEAMAKVTRLIALLASYFHRNEVEDIFRRDNEL